MKTNLDMIAVSLFQRLSSLGSASCSLKEVLRLIRYDKAVIYTTEAYRQMSTVLGKKKADQNVKCQKLPAFAVAVKFDGNGRTDSNILGFTGLALCDLDHLDDVEPAARALQADPHVLLLYRTVSGHGLRVIYLYRLESEPETHPDATSWPAAFLHGNRHFAQVVDAPFDGQCGDYGRLSGIAHDEHVYCNADAEPFVITDAEVIEANLASERKAGRPRDVLPTGSQQHTVAEVWPWVEHILDNKHLAFAPGSHHNYVMHAAFLFNRYGVSREELSEWASAQWADYAAAQREATLRSVYAHTDDHGTWRLPRKAGARGGSQRKSPQTASLLEVSKWFDDHFVLTYNEVTDQTFVRAKDSKTEVRADDRLVRSLLKRVSDELGVRVLKGDVQDILGSDQARKLNPVRDYINALPRWDGVDRVAQIAGHIKAEPACWDQTEEQAQQTLLWMLHKWLVAMVAGWLSDKNLNQTIFVLIGPQGIYKTTFWRFLLPEPLRQYFWENAHNSFSSKDDRIALTENCLVEIEEIDMSNAHVLAEVKALATAHTIKERPPYHAYAQERHRMASICASGNQQNFLADDSGNRRWLCHLVSHVDDPREWQLDYEQLYAQLRDELIGGFRYWFTAGEQARVEKQNEAFRIESEEEQLIRARLRVPKPGEPWKLFNCVLIAQHLNSYGRVSATLNARKIGVAMRKLGFMQVHTVSGNFYRVFIIEEKDLQSKLLQEISEQTDTQEVEGELDLPF